MIKIDIFSGFLGAGKTTLIKKLIKEAYAGEKVVLIENEFGEIGIDGGFMQDAGINVTEMNSGCICCSLVGDFAEALKKVAIEYEPERIVIEPSGVGKLSDVIKAVASAGLENASLNVFCTVVDAGKCKMYMKNFGEFFNDQVENASCIVLSHTDKATEDKLNTAVRLLREKNASASLITSSWESISGKEILAVMERKDTLQAELDRLAHEIEEVCECHDEHCECHHHHDHDHEHCCHEHHEHEHEHCCHEHHEHEHEHCCHEHHEHEHEHCCHEHHEHEHEHCCHEHDEHGHEHHHHHHADDVFTSWGKETAKTFSKEVLTSILQTLSDEHACGTVLRAKGIVQGENGWLHFDYTPNEVDVREGCAGATGRICVIGCDLKEDTLATLFGI